jgi:hypothetical protein
LRIFGPKGDETVEGWRRKLYNKELQNLLPISKYDCNAQVRKTDGKRPLERPGIPAKIQFKHLLSTSVD